MSKEASGVLRVVAGRVLRPWPPHQRVASNLAFGDALLDGLDDLVAWVHRIGLHALMMLRGAVPSQAAVTSDVSPFRMLVRGKVA